MPGNSGIVYCLSRKKTEETAAFLERSGVRALAYHAGMTKEARDANQNRFMTEAGVVMVATIAFGMGIDKPDVAYVFHTDLPGNLEAYYQEIGRAGRDGRAGRGAYAVRRWAISACAACSSMTKMPATEHKRRAHGRLGTLIGYCETARMPPPDPAAIFRGNRGAVRQLRQLPGPGAAHGRHGGGASSFSRPSRNRANASAPAHIVDILRGAGTQKIKERGHDRLACFGSGAARKKEEWQSLIRQLVAGGFPDRRRSWRPVRSPKGARTCAAATQPVPFPRTAAPRAARRAPRLRR